MHDLACDGPHALQGPPPRREHVPRSQRRPICHGTIITKFIILSFTAGIARKTGEKEFAGRRDSAGTEGKKRGLDGFGMWAPSGLSSALLVPAVLLYLPALWALINFELPMPVRKSLAVAIGLNALGVLGSWRAETVPTGNSFKTVYVWSPRHVWVVFLCLLSPAHIPLVVMRQHHVVPLPDGLQHHEPTVCLILAAIQGYWTLMLTHMHLKRESILATMHRQVLSIEHGYTGMLKSVRQKAEAEVVSKIKGR